MHNSQKCSTFAADFSPMIDKEQYIVDLDRLSEGKYDFSFTLDKDFLSGIDKTELIDIEAEVNADLTLRADDFDLTLDVKSTATITCDRCLDPMQIKVNAQEEHVETEEGVKKIDLAWLAYEMIIVNLPTVHSHPVGGCNPEMAALLQSHLCSTEEEPETI